LITWPNIKERRLRDKRKSLPTLNSRLIKILANPRIRDPKKDQEKRGDTRSGKSQRTNCTSPESWRK
jgi:hypothetical protein